MIRAGALALLFFSLAWTTAPRLLELARQGVDLLPLDREQRNSRVHGSFYDALREIDRRVPRGEPLALMVRSQSDVDVATFANYYLYPRPTRIYSELGQYRLDPKRPKTIVRIDTTNDPPLGIATYAAIRADQIGTDFVTSQLGPEGPPARRFIAPLVASTDGAPPDMFTTEAALENVSKVPARVRIELLPQRIIANVTLEPGERKSWNDIVYQLFGDHDRGWLRVESDQPVRAAFWYVNRGRRQSVLMPQPEPVREVSFAAPPGSRLWFVNPQDRQAAILVKGQPLAIDALGWRSVTAGGEEWVTSDGPLIVFLSSRERDGRVTFQWSGVKR